MKLAFLAYQIRWMLPFQLLLAVIGAVAGNLRIAVPSVSGSGDIPVTLLSALLGVMLLALPINATWPANRTVAARAPAVVLVGVTGATVAPAMLASILIGTTVADSSGFQYVGGFTWLLAIQLLIGVFMSGRLQALGPSLYVLLCALLGRVDASVQPWAWPLANIPAAFGVGAGCAALLFAVALLLGMGLHDSEGT